MFLVEGSFMRTLTFPFRAPLRGPQLQDKGGGAYMNYTLLSKKPQFFSKGPRSRSLQNWRSGRQQYSQHGAQEEWGKRKEEIRGMNLHCTVFKDFLWFNVHVSSTDQSTTNPLGYDEHCLCFCSPSDTVHWNDCFLSLAQIESVLSILYWDSH